MIRTNVDYVCGVDSLTRHESSYGYRGHRKRIYDFGAARGYSLVSRGHTANGGGGGGWGVGTSGVDDRHSAVSGQTISGAHSLLSAQLGAGGSIAGANGIDLLLMCCGAGNVVIGSSEPYVQGDTVPNALRAFYQMLLDKEANAVLAILDIPPQNSNQTAVDNFNAELPAMVKALRAANPTRKIRFRPGLINLACGGPTFNAGNFVDDRHPNESTSYTAMGSAILSLIAPDISESSWFSGESSGLGALTAAARSLLVDHVRNVAPYSPAANHYVHLYTTGGVAITPGTASGYTVYSHANDSALWPDAVGRLKANGIEMTFGTPTGTWPDVVEARVTTSATEGAGTVLATETFAAVPVSVATGVFSIPAYAFSIIASPVEVVGGWSDLAWQGAINRMFGGAANTPLTTVYGSWWTDDPYTVGTQLGSRVAITQASKWGAASSGVAQTSGDILLAHQSSGLWWVEHDASSGGNLLYTAPRGVTGPTGVTGTIAAGKLRTSLS